MSTPLITFPFDTVVVHVSPSRDKVIEWTMNKRFRIQYPIKGFHIDISFGGEWLRLSEELIVGTCFYVDSDRYRCGLRDDIYYRVIAVDEMDNEYKSKPTWIYECWKNKQQWLIARDIIRKEYLRLTRLPVGVSGRLFKARQSGPRCTECTDWDTGEVSGPGCSTCYGTGFKGGYYNAIPYYMDLSGTSSQETETATFGVVDNKQRIARAVSYPIVNVGDMWAVDKTNQRFLINKVASVGETLIIPIVYQLYIAELPQSADAYKVPDHQPMDTLYEDTSNITNSSFNEGITTNITW